MKILVKIDDDWSEDGIFKYLLEIEDPTKLFKCKLVYKEESIEGIHITENSFEFKNIRWNLLSQKSSSSLLPQNEILENFYFEITLSKFKGTEYQQVIKRRLDICERNGNKFNISILPNKIIQKLKENIPNNSNIFNLNFENEFEINKNEIKETNKFNELIEELFKENEWKIYYLKLKNLDLLKNKKEKSYEEKLEIKLILDEINLFNEKMKGEHLSNENNIVRKQDVQIKKEYLNLNAKYTREMIEEITEIAKESIENGGIKLQKNEASKYLKKIYAFSEKYEISYNSVKKIRNNLIAQQEVNKETMEKELSKEKSKQEIEENNGNIKEIYYIAREYEYLANSDNHSSEEAREKIKNESEINENEKSSEETESEMEEIIFKGKEKKNGKMKNISNFVGESSKGNSKGKNIKQKGKPKLKKPKIEYDYSKNDFIAI
uniref:MATH domain-containing protein n=1 Tax=Meloidogyne floridensis TaxID=298350 RepID=A0A915NZK9_9BILA